jgi:hypothetical protein
MVLFETRYVHAALKYDGFELRAGFPRRHRTRAKELAPAAMKLS